jgi:hypothetical protein
MHLLDFLPCCYWQSQLGDPLFGMFIEVHEFLKGTGKLEAKLDFSLSNPGEVDQVKESYWWYLVLGIGACTV